MAKHFPAHLSWPFSYAGFSGGRQVFVPTIPIYLKTNQGLVEFNFLVDTGADLTTLPHFMASRLGIDLKLAEKSMAEGLAGVRVKTWLTQVELIFKHTSVRVPVSITNENSTPFLLGRGGLLDVLYSWHFDAGKKEIKFDTI